MISILTSWVYGLLLSISSLSVTSFVFRLPPSKALQTSKARSQRANTWFKFKSTKQDGASVDVDDDDESMLPLMKLASAHCASQALRAMVQLGLPDILGAETKTMAEIASAIGPSTNQDALLRTLRLLTTVDILKEKVLQVDEDDTIEEMIAFELTKSGVLLRKGPSSMAFCVQHWMEAPLWNSWLELPGYIKGEEGLPFDRANGGVSSDFYYNAQDHPESLQIANDFVRMIYNGEINAILNGFDWGSLSGKTVLDVGGHHGKVIGAVANKFPTINCKCLDLPEVIASATAPPPGVELIGGSIFDNPSSIPQCDVILMKHFLDRCMWDEQQSVEILKTCHSVLPPDGIVLIGEAVVPDVAKADDSNQLQLYMDALYLIVGRERQRTESEWANLASKAGFQIEKVTATSSPSCYMIVLTKMSK
jgi:hypothetical protein